MKIKVVTIFVLVIQFICLICLSGCGVSENKSIITKNYTVEFPIELLSLRNDKSVINEIFAEEGFNIYPSSVHINGSKIYISMFNKIYVIDTEGSEVQRALFIENNKYNLLNFNAPNSIVSDNKGNIFVENIFIEEKLFRNKKTHEKYLKPVKTTHKILKFDYEGNFLFPIGPEGINDDNHFKSNESIVEIITDDKGNLSLIIRETNIEDRSSSEFSRQNMEIYTYRFIRYNDRGKVIYTLDISNLNNINKSSENFVRIIESIKLDPQGNKIYIATKDLTKKENANSEYTVEYENSQIFIYNLGLNKIEEKSIKVKDSLFYLFGASKNNKLFLTKPSGIYELRFIVMNLKGKIEENKLIMVNNVRQKRYDFFFNEEGFISNIFKEKDKIRIIQYR
jgi:hypothetical protein